MSQRKPIARTILATALLALLAPTSLGAAPTGNTVLSGRCQYSDRVASHRADTALILCDTATISRDAASTSYDFSQRSWGSMARFTGNGTPDSIAITQVTLRDGRTLDATGSCRTFYRNDGKISVISCLATAASRSFAANFIPSRL